jgi:hypothetical protein
MSAGLDASTVTPGSTAPDVSLTTPAIALVCASAVAGSSPSSAAAKVNRATMRMLNLLLESCSCKERESPRAAVVPTLYPAFPGNFRGFHELLITTACDDSKFPYLEMPLSVSPVDFRRPTDRSVGVLKHTP